jgi:uncharacterized protein YndB with AHSA1/START domain
VADPVGGWSVEHATIVVERLLAAARARVFAAWVEPGARARWDVPGPGWEHVEHDRDVRVGGRDSISFGPPGDLRYRADTTYHDLVADTRLVFAYTVRDGDELLSVSLTTVELWAMGAEPPSTRLRVTEQATFLDGRDDPATRRQGLEEMLDGLAAQLR